MRDCLVLNYDLGMCLHARDSFHGPAVKSMRFGHSHNAGLSYGARGHRNGPPNNPRAGTSPEADSCSPGLPLAGHLSRLGQLGPNARARDTRFSSNRGSASRRRLCRHLCAARESVNDRTRVTLLFLWERSSDDENRHFYICSLVVSSTESLLSPLRKIV